MEVKEKILGLDKELFQSVVMPSIGFRGEGKLVIVDGSIERYIQEEKSKRSFTVYENEIDRGVIFLSYANKEKSFVCVAKDIESGALRGSRFESIEYFPTL